MQDRWAPFVRPEDLYISPVPVVRVYDKFAERDHGDIQGLFLRNGYTVVTGGRHNRNNPLELSVDFMPSFKIPSPGERAQTGVEVSGIPLPNQLTLPETIRTEEPVIAKDICHNKGMNKFLLETLEQKIRFASWMLHVQRYSPGNEEFYSRPGYLERLRRHVSSDVFYFNIDANPNWNWGWVQEEFVETPGDFYTSFRILADGYGEVHYGFVTKSKHKKDEDKRVKERPRIPNSLIDPMDPSGNASLLVDPNSPFFLGSRAIVSNTAAGGSPILLDGARKIDESDRKVLEDLGINPDKPEIPSRLLEASSAISHALRAGIPFMGIDFMKRRDSEEFVLLEVNVGPMISPGSVGLSENASRTDLNYRMYERIIERAKASNPQAFGTA